MVKKPVWLKMLLGLAVLRIGVGLLGFAVGGPAAPAETGSTVAPALPLLLDVLVFSGGGLLLLIGGRDDPRPFHLGAFFVVLATSFTHWSTGAVAASLDGPARTLVLLLRNLHPDAFLPVLLWLFVSVFPRSPRPRELRTLYLGTYLAAALGTVLFAANLLGAFWTLEGQAPPGILLPLIRDHSLYYPPIMVFQLAALGILVVRMRKASTRARRRSWVFVSALLLACVPIFLSSILINVIPPFRELINESRIAFLISFWVLHGFFLTLPFTTAYAVLVQRVMDVKLLARQALQYLLARASVVTLTLLPMAGLVVYLFQQREQPLAVLLSGRRLLALLAATCLGVAALRYRHRWLERIDRRFFRERYDSRRLLSDLAHRMRNTRDPLDMANLVVHGLDRALHLERAALLVDDPSRGLLADPQGRTRPLDASSALARLAASAREPLETDFTTHRSPVRRLPREDRHWLVDEGFHLLVPLTASDGVLLGLLALGEKKSGLPFLREDRELLQAIAGSAALGLEVFRVRAESATTSAADSEEAAERPPGTESAQECFACGRVHPPHVETCSHCGKVLATASVPLVLPGRFRFEERVGVGGMGVVYRATDLALGRPVAVKTLRRVSPEHALRLRREARTAAAVTHPNLAFVYGLETWNGTPMLIMEFLEKGTLAQRIDEGPLEPEETAVLGIAMARGLVQLHREDVLHRDVKPSNIGYARDGTPKLMDFGIARLQSDLRREEAGTATGDGSHLPATSIWNRPRSVTTTHHIVGTLAYLAPETLEGQRPDPSADLWGLALVLHECLTGVRVFQQGDDDQERFIHRIVNSRVPDVRDVRPDCPPELSVFLSWALEPDPRDRPLDAEEFAAGLEESLRRIAA